jgi:alkylation response protein AidB-like acyl-CoA dehydrogenase
VTRGELPHFAAGPLARERRLAELAKLAATFAMKAAVEALGPAIAERQEVLGALADALAEAYALDSAVGRALQGADGPPPVAEACVRLYAVEAHERALAAARRAVRCAVPEPEACRALLGKLGALADEEPVDLTALRERIVEAALAAGGYPLGGTT